MIFFSSWEYYDPSWLVKLAKEQYPNDEWLHDALRKCTKIKQGCYFVEPKNPNKPGSEWQFEKSIILEDPEKDEVVLDILKDGRVGSMEFMGLKLQRK